MERWGVKKSRAQRGLEQKSLPTLRVSGEKKDVTYLHIDNLASFFLPQDTSHDWLLIRGQQEILW